MNVTEGSAGRSSALQHSPIKRKRRSRSGIRDTTKNEPGAKGSFETTGPRDDKARTIPAIYVSKASTPICGEEQEQADERLHDRCGLQPEKMLWIIDWLDGTRDPVPEGNEDDESALLVPPSISCHPFGENTAGATKMSPLETARLKAFLDGILPAWRFAQDNKLDIKAASPAWKTEETARTSDRPLPGLSTILSRLYKYDGESVPDRVRDRACQRELDTHRDRSKSDRKGDGVGDADGEELDRNKFTM